MGNFLDNVATGAFVFAVFVLILGGCKMIKENRKDLMSAWWFFLFIALVSGAWIWR